MHCSKRTAKPLRGFTLVEIMIVVVIIGMLVALAIPGMKKVRENSQASAISNNFRIFAGAFQSYNLEQGVWPGSHWDQGTMPTEMDGYMNADDWVNGCPLNGYYAFNDPGDGTSVAIILAATDMSADLQRRVDEAMDDGDLSSGIIRGDNQSLDFYLEEDRLPGSG